MSDTTEGYRISLDAQIDKLEGILKDNPDDPSALMAFGEMSLRRGRKLMALLAFQRVASMKPDLLDVHLALTKIYVSQKMYAEAYGELIQALKTERESVEARVLYDILVHEAKPPVESLPFFRSAFSFPYKAEDLHLYIQQLEIEKDRLGGDVRELSVLLESSPMDTILEYNKNMAARRLKVIEELLEKAKNIKDLKFEEPSGADYSAEAHVDVEPVSAAPERVEAAEAGFSEAASETLSGDAAGKERLIRSLRENLDPIMQNLKKTKSVLAVLAFSIKGEIIHAVYDGEWRVSELIRSLLPSLSALSSFSSDMIYWVLEFAQGVMVIQTVAPGFFLCALGDAGTGFGSIRYFLDRNRSLLRESVKDLDLSRLSE